jgi:hypothetical protein
MLIYGMVRFATLLAIALALVVQCNSPVDDSLLSNYLLYDTVKPNPPNLVLTQNKFVFKPNTNLQISPVNSGGEILSCSITPNLPDGLSMDSKTCKISGSAKKTLPETTFTVTALGSSESSVVFSLKIESSSDIATLVDTNSSPSGLSYSSPSLQFVIFTPLSNVVPSVSGTSPMEYSISGGTLPAGLSMNSRTGTISGTPIELFSPKVFTITASNEKGMTQTNLTISVVAVASAPTYLTYPSSTITGYVDIPITGSTPSTNGSYPMVFTITPNLPLGITLNPGTGTLQGVPSQSGSSQNYTITATNAGGSITTSVNISIQSSPTLPSFGYGSNQVVATKGVTIQPLYPTVTSGSSPISYSILPSLPDGITINSVTGAISGTPAQLSPKTLYTVYATNPKGTSSYSFYITIIDSPLSNLALSVSSISMFAGESQTITNTIQGTPIYYSVLPALPSGLTLNTGNGVITGIPKTVQTATQYFITATNSAGSVTTTLSISIDLPPTVIAIPSGLLKTGQVTSYLAGDDGYYQTGSARNFTPAGSSTMYWQKCSGGQTNDTNCTGTIQTYNYTNAVAYCTNLTLGGLTWRLPTLYELWNLVNYGKSDPSIETTIFPNTIAGDYWSSTNNSANLTSYRIHSFASGSQAQYFYAQTSSYYVRCISGPTASPYVYVDNQNGTITNSTLGLIWQKCSAGTDYLTACSGTASKLSWSDSVNYCEGLTLGGRSDWRLPNINELKTLSDYSKTTNPIFNTTYFPIGSISTTTNIGYWSSTSSIGFTTYGWTLDYFMSNGSTGASKNFSSKDINFNYVRCITGP